MTRMTKDETQLLAQAAAIVDTLLPFKKQVPKEIEPEKGLIDAATPTWKPVIDLPLNAGKTAAMTEVVKKWKDENISYWMNESTKWPELVKDSGMGIISNYAKKHEALFKEYYQNQFKDFHSYFDDSYFSDRIERTPAFMKRCKEIFQKAFSIIRQERFWCQGALARRIERGPSLNDTPVPEYKVCSIGAILLADGRPGRSMEHANNVGGSGEARYVMHQLQGFMGGRIDAFNDKNPHKFVVQAWENCGQANGWL